MPTTTRTFTVEPAPAVVLEYLKDFGNAEQWDPGTESCTRNDSGPVVVGSSWKNVSKIAGVETDLTYTLTEVAADHITLVGENKTATSTDTITFVPSGTGSQITYEAVVELNGVAKLGAPAVKLVFERMGDKTEEQMTAVLNRVLQSS